MKASALLVEHAASHHLLDQAVVDGARHRRAGAKQVGAAVAAVGPGNLVLVQVDRGQHHGRAHRRQRAALGLARHDVEVGARDEPAQHLGIEPRICREALQHAAARDGRRDVASAVAARAVGHQAGDEAAVVPVAEHVFVVAAAALPRQGDDFYVHGPSSFVLFNRRRI